MSEQAKILSDLQTLIMDILKTGTATVEQGKKLDNLEALLHKQRSFKETKHPDYSYQGEEIAALFFNENFIEAIDKLYEYKISDDDFFGFAEYHYDEDEDVELVEKTFTPSFKEKVKKAYELKCNTK